MLRASVLGRFPPAHLPRGEQSRRAVGDGFDFWERWADDTIVVTPEYGHGDRGVDRENINRAGWLCASRFDSDFAVFVGGFWGWIGGGFGGDFPLLDT